MAESKTKKKELARLRVRVQAYEPRILDASVRQIIDTATRLGTTVIGPIPLPNKIQRFTVNRSTFAQKDAREQFERRTHTRILDIESPSTQAVEALSTLTLPAGVSIEAKMVS